MMHRFCPKPSPNLRKLCWNYRGILIFLAFTGCSLWDDPSSNLPSGFEDDYAPPEEQEDASVSRSELSERSLTGSEQPFRRGNRALFDDIEVVWEIPKQAVDGFIIEYGEAQSSLYKRERVTTLDLERFDHPRYGYVYRHIVKGVPSSKPVEVFIRAFKGEEVSEPSKALVVPPRREHVQRRPASPFR